MDDQKMSVSTLLGKVSSPYERKARLYPAFLALTPVLGIAALYGFALEGKGTLISLVSGLGGFYLLSNIVREAGKRIEARLYDKWCGTPTTQLQRHKDPTIDPVTKAFRHAFLAKKLGVAFPSAAQEAADPVRADGIYAAGTRWLLDHTRDREKFALLFGENIAYGFRRNCLGLKPIAITICVGAIAWVLLYARFALGAGFSTQGLARFNGGTLLAFALSVVMLLIWTFFFTQRSVKTAAFSYADMLLRACSALN